MKNFSKNIFVWIIISLILLGLFNVFKNSQRDYTSVTYTYSTLLDKAQNGEIKSVEITTHESAIRIISKVGELNNPADRDHCLQYMVAIGLLKGNLVAEDYEDDVAKDPRIDALREKMVINEDKRYSKEYLEADKRSIANRIKIHFNDGTSTEEVEVEYPIGHKRRREEGIPVLEKKFKDNLDITFNEEVSDKIFTLCMNQEKLEETSVTDFQKLFSKIP